MWHVWIKTEMLTVLWFETLKATDHLEDSYIREKTLTFRHRASSTYNRCFATLQRMLFIYLINKYISLSGICLTVHH